VRSFQPEMLGQGGWCVWGGGGARAGGSGWAKVMIVCQRPVCWRVGTRRARSTVVALPGVGAEPGDDPPVLKVAEAVFNGARAADRAWLAWRWAGVVLQRPVVIWQVARAGRLAARGHQQPETSLPGRVGGWLVSGSRVIGRQLRDDLFSYDQPLQLALGIVELLAQQHDTTSRDSHAAGGNRLSCVVPRYRRYGGAAFTVARSMRAWTSSRVGAATPTRRASSTGALSRTSVSRGLPPSKSMSIDVL
jgi:hypothetical protein